MKIVIFALMLIYSSISLAQEAVQEAVEVEQPLSAEPLSSEQLVELMKDRELLRHYHQIWQMWAMSNNYRHGTTVEKDLALSYAWMRLYVDSLPSGYPGMKRLLDSLKAELSEEQIKRAEESIDVLRNTHQLSSRLNERELRRAFELSENLPEFPTPSSTAMVDFPQLIEQLKQDGKEDLADQLQNRMAAAEMQQSELPGSVIVFGRLLVPGYEDPSMVNANINVGSEGYFVQVIPGYLRRIYFSLTGYQPAQITIANASKVNLGEIALTPITESQRAMIVGYIVPNTRLSDVNIVLKIIPEAGELATKHDPWQTTLTPITITPEGQFYAEGLSPANYRLVISSHGQVLASQEFQLRPGQQRNISNIRLPPRELVS